MSTQPTTDYLSDFKTDLVEIDKLRATPNLIRDHAVGALELLLKSETGLTNTARQKVTNAKLVLERIGDQSMADNFRTIYSQMCILSVSSLEALLKRYFERAAADTRNLNLENRRLAELKISVLDILAEQQRFGGKLGRLIIEKDNKLNFQDLKAIKRTMSEYFGKEIKLSKADERTCCFYLELRHVLVHRGGRVDQKFLDATEVLNANLKGYKLGDRVVLSEEDWLLMGPAFSSLVSAATTITRTSK